MLATRPVTHRMFRHKGSTPTSPSQSLAIPFRAAGSAVCLENNGYVGDGSEDWRSEFFSSSFVIL
jgi:hypothetical protein